MKLFFAVRKFVFVSLTFTCYVFAAPIDHSEERSDPARAAAESPVRILAFGDSLLAGYGLNDLTTAFPHQLEQALNTRGVAATVIPGSVAGDTTQGGISRIEWSLSDKPDLVIVALGANDMLRGLDPALMRNNLKKIVTTFQANDVDVLLVGTPALGNWGEVIQQGYAAAFVSVADDTEVPFVADLLKDVAGIPKLNQSDGIHPNEKGVTLMVRNLLPALLDLLAPRDKFATRPTDN